MKETAILAAEEAGKILRGNFGKIKETTTKKDKSLVTNVDLQCEKKILEIIKSKFPGHHIISEESGDNEMDSEYSWYIDPLDGTHNYIYNLPHFGTSIGLYKNNEPLLGVIYLPLFDELYYAEKGKGAFLNDNQLKIEQKPIEECIFQMDSQFARDQETYISNLQKLVPSFFGFRVAGSAVACLSFIAKNCAGAWLTYMAKNYDVAAGRVILEEAGGKVTTAGGKPWQMDNVPLLATNGLIHNQVVELLR